MQDFQSSTHHVNSTAGTAPSLPNWVQGLFSFGTPNGLPKSLMCWVHGSHALQMESLPPDAISRDVMSTLQRFQGGRPVPEAADVAHSGWASDPLFRGSYSYVAVGSSEDDIHELARPLPYLEESEDGGASQAGQLDQNRSAPSLEVSEANKSTGSSFEELKSSGGLPDVEGKQGMVAAKLQSLESPERLRVLFAGEAAHAHYYSTTHGAWLSGLREAKQILRAYKLESSDLTGLERVAFGLSSIEEALQNKTL
jgi:hypothetical protein